MIGPEGPLFFPKRRKNISNATTPTNARLPNTDPTTIPDLLWDESDESSTASADGVLLVPTIPPVTPEDEYRGLDEVVDGVALLAPMIMGPVWPVGEDPEFDEVASTESSILG